MNRNMNQHTFIELAKALEEGVITIEQFHVLSNIQNLEAIGSIIATLKLENLQNKEEIFEKITQIHIYYLFLINRVLYYNPIYRVDKDRQKFLFENLELSLEDFEILAQDVFWKDQKFKTMLLETKADNHIKREVYRCANKIESEDSPFFEEDQNRQIIIKAFQLTDVCGIQSFFNCLKISSIQKEPLWFDQLITFYNQYSKGFNWSLKLETIFQLLEKNQKMEIVTKKMKELDNPNIEKNKKEQYIQKFFGNLLCFQKEFIELPIDNRYFEFLLSSSLNVEDEVFEDYIYIIKNGVEQSMSFDQIKNFCININEIQDSCIRAHIIGAVFNHLLKIEDIKLFILMEGDAVRSYITKRAIEQDNYEYINAGMNYFPHILPDYFYEFMENSDITEEQIITISHLLLDCPEEFSDDKFILKIDLIEKEKKEHQKKITKI